MTCVDAGTVSLPREKENFAPHICHEYRRSIPREFICHIFGRILVWQSNVELMHLSKGVIMECSARGYVPSRDPNGWASLQIF
jgi:hypothetical protein